MSAIIPLAIEVEEYLRDRRRLGFSLAREGTQLLAFARFADARGYDGHLVEAIAVAWAQRGQQGNRVKKSTPNETCQVVVVPRSDKSAGLHGILFAGRF
jgi:hypothetical protein